MDRQHVISSHIKSIGHDNGTKTLEIEFVNGDVYRYEGVEYTKYEELLRHPSAGRAFHALVKGQHPEMRVEDT